MPNYDLRCQVCKQEFRTRASIADKTARRIPCPECGALELETLFKTPPAYVKGKGTAPAPCPNRGGCGVGGACPHAG